MLKQVVIAGLVAAGLYAVGVTASAATSDPDRPIVELNQDELPVRLDPVPPTIEPFDNQVPILPIR